MCEKELDARILPYMTKMIYSNPDLEKLLFDCEGAEYLEWMYYLKDVICNGSHPQTSIFVWPKLRHLVLRCFDSGFWQSDDEVACLAQFLAAHSNLETLVLHKMAFQDQNPLPLSLALYPGSLPGLKVLLGSPRLIAGVLESTAACSSITSIIDNSEEQFDEGGAKAPYIDRIIAALEKVPTNQVRRLQLEVPQLNRETYARLARVAPNVQSIEFLIPYESESITSPDANFDPLVSL